MLRHLINPRSSETTAPPTLLWYRPHLLHFFSTFLLSNDHGGQTRPQRAPLSRTTHQHRRPLYGQAARLDREVERGHLGLDRVEVAHIESILTTLEEDVKGIKSKDRLCIPHVLTATPLLNGKDPELCSPPELLELSKHTRGESLNAVADGMAIRMALHDKAIKAGKMPNTRFSNPLVAVQSSPGGGKSTFLDIIGRICATASWDDELCPDKDMRGILNASIPVSITFNSPTIWQPDVYDTSHNRALGLRIVHSFFVHPEGASLRQLAEKLPSLGPELAILACRAYMHMHCSDRSALLILVDETRKTTDYGKDIRMISELGNVLDTHSCNTVNILATTLDTLAFQKLRTDSGRSTIWAPLAGFCQKDAEGMFLQAAKLKIPEHLAKLPLVAVSTASDSAAGYISGEKTGGKVHILPLVVRIAISDCAGHPRTLEKLQEVFEDHLRDYNHDWESKTALRALRDGAIGIMSGGTILTPSLTAVRLALENQPIDLKTMIDDEGATFSDLIASGMFLNAGIRDRP